MKNAERDREGSGVSKEKARKLTGDRGGVLGILLFGRSAAPLIKAKLALSTVDSTILRCCCVLASGRRSFLKGKKIPIFVYHADKTGDLYFSLFLLLLYYSIRSLI
jgi:hypothetical protein